MGVQLHPPMGSAFEKKTKKTNNKKKKKLVTHLHLVRYNDPASRSWEVRDLHP